MYNMMKNFYNIKEINIFKKLIASGVHIGKKTNKWNPKTSIYLFGQRKTNNIQKGKETNILTKTKGINIHLIDIEQTIVMLRRAITFIQKISKNRGIILYVPSTLEKRLWMGEQSGESLALAGSTGIEGSREISSSWMHEISEKNPSKGNIAKSQLRDGLKTKDNGVIKITSGIKKDIKIFDTLPYKKTLDSLPQNPTTITKNISSTDLNNDTIQDQFVETPNNDKTSSLKNKKVSTFSPSNIREKIFEINKQRNQKFYIPQALFITNTTEHKTLIREAVKLQIPIIGIVDSNGNSYGIEFPIPGNTQSMESQEIYTQIMFHAIADGKKTEGEILTVNSIQ